MKSSTRFLVLGTAGLAGVIALVAWHFTGRTEPASRGPVAVAAVPTAPVAGPVAADRDANIRVTLYALRRLPPAEYTQGLLAALEAIGRQDPVRALRLAREFVTTREQRAFYNSLFAQLAATDPAAAVSRLGLVPAGENRERALRALADGWAARDLPAALAWARTLGPEDRPPAMESVLAALTPGDPKQAIELARQTLAGAAFDRALTAALQSLVAANPAEAGAIVSSLQPGELQMRAALDVARAMAGQNPGEALTWAATLPAGSTRDLAVGNILEVWAGHQPQAAAGHVATMPPGSARETAALLVARRWTAVNPTAAIAWAQTLAGDQARNRTLAFAVSIWAQREPAAAVQWAAATPGLPTEALPGALSHWLLQDADAAKSFVLALAGENQVRAAAAIAPTLAQTDPLAALAWTQTLSEPAARESALAAAYARWRLNNPAAARAWLAQAGLPAATKARLSAGP